MPLEFFKSPASMQYYSVVDAAGGPDGRAAYFDTVSAFLSSKKTDGTNRFARPTQKSYSAALNGYSRFRERQGVSLDPRSAFADVGSLRGFLQLSLEAGSPERTVMERAKCLRGITDFVLGEESVARQIYVGEEPKEVQRRKPFGEVLNPNRIERIIEMAQKDGDLRTLALFGLLSDGVTPRQVARLQRTDLQVKEGLMIAVTDQRGQIVERPLSDRTRAAVEAYLEAVRSPAPDPQHLFFCESNSKRGAPIQRNAAYGIASNYERRGGRRLNSSAGRTPRPKKPVEAVSEKIMDGRLPAEVWDEDIFPLTETTQMQSVVFPALTSLTGQGALFIVAGSSERFTDKAFPAEFSYDVSMPSRKPSGRFDSSLQIKVYPDSDKNKAAEVEFTREGTIIIRASDGGVVFKSKPAEELTKELVVENIKAALSP